MVRAVRMVQRNALVYRHVWKGSLFSSFVQPTLFLLAMGYGVGTLIDGAGVALPHGLPYVGFLAPGLLAAACMQTAAWESTWPINEKIRWRRNYDAILATPLTIPDIVVGELWWIGLRLTSVATAFVAVMILFGVVQISARIVLLPFAAVLTGLAFSAPILAYTGTVEDDNAFNLIYRFGLTPMFLFSGVFFPLSRLPLPLQRAAWVSPLFHGVELTRGVIVGLTATEAVVHVLFLIACLAGGFLGALHTFRRRLTP